MIDYATRQAVNEAVVLPVLATTGNVLRGWTFTNCQVIGPAVVSLSGAGKLDGVSIDLAGLPVESVFIEVPDDRPPMTGVLQLDACELVGCVLRNVAFIGGVEFLDRLRVGFMGL